MRTIIEEENKKIDNVRSVNILSDSFLGISDIQDINNSVLPDSSLRSIDRRISKTNIINSKVKRNNDLLLMFKVNDELTKKDPNDNMNVSNKFDKFSANDEIIKETLNKQETLIADKLRFRRDKNRSKEYTMMSKLMNNTSGNILNRSKNDDTRRYTS